MTLPAPGIGPDHDLALRHQPILRIDLAEPYAPLVMGYTVFRAPAPSPGSKFTVTPQGAICIEYAVWYDWDIGHLYDLEHVWIHLDQAGEIVAVEASFHGQRVPMDLAGGLPRIEDRRPVLFSEPGKHAHWADGVAMNVRTGDTLRDLCSTRAGIESVHRGNPFFAAGAYQITPLADRLARRKMQRDAFAPRFAFRDSATPVLTPWPALAAWIPARMTQLIADLPALVPHLAAVFLDCGDTLIDEATEVKITGTDIVTAASAIPGAVAAVRTLHDLGYPLVLVADGPRETFENLLKPLGIWDLMQAHVISGDVGALKPDPRMFAKAMEALKLDDPSRVVMVGNNLERDIRGANSYGLTSLFVGWSKRRSHRPLLASDIPDAAILRLDQLVAAIQALELALPEVAHG